MSNEVAKLRSTELATQSTNITTPNAVECIMEGLKQAITEMKADDLCVDLSASQNGNQSNAQFRIRAYRRGQKVLDERSK